MIMELRNLEGKTVRLIDNEGKEYKGYVGDYIYPEDNEPEGVEAIILDDLIRTSDGYKFENPVEFTALEIQTIENI